jgi:CO dehydrogenase/acetyl-CoA synthase alpha subunit
LQPRLSPEKRETSDVKTIVQTNGGEGLQQTREGACGIKMSAEQSPRILNEISVGKGVVST